MPNYKTHSIHIDKCSDYIDSRIQLDKEDLKVFSFGPDTLVFTDPLTFNNQHNTKTSLFFLKLIKKIKETSSLDNKEIISFLYGQLSHFIVDLTFHPYIYYVTNNLKNNNFINSHLQYELWLDNYFMNKYKIDNKNYYKKDKIDNNDLKHIIDDIYFNVYKCVLASKKYNIGINIIKSLENNLRNNETVNYICNNLNIGDIKYSNEYSILEEFLNNDRNTWLDPITGEENIISINEIWNTSISRYIETIEDVNAYLYDDKELKNRFILSNLSYDTSLPCETKKEFIYAKKY